MRQDGSDDSDVVMLPGSTGVRLSSSKAALLCRIPVGTDVVSEWIPVSVISDDSEVWKPDQTGKLVIQRWIAREKELLPKT